MQCYVYKSLAKRDVYVYLDRRGDFTRLPPGLAQLLGELQFVVEFEMTARRVLAKETAAAVLQNLTTQGYHLQMPDTERPAPDSAH
ncbi:MAG: YcgL domain-containing protein [Gammaproteobacteria bacterium]|nr:YcgL domain-containing protein [Gammaproteobacteria bacterium]